MSRPKNVYLSKRAVTALRHTDSLSGRVNQIIDRYLAITASREAHVRATFSREEWERLLDTGKTLDMWLAADVWTVMDSFSRVLDDDAGMRLEALDLVECMTLFEMLERDIAAATPLATQSEAP